MINWLNEKKIQDRIFDITWFLIMAVSLLRLSAWYPLDKTLRMEHAMLIIEYVCCGLCLVIILLNFLCRKYNWKVIVGYGILAVIFALTAYFADNEYMVIYFLVFGAAYGQDSRRIITISAAVTAFMIFLLVVLSLTGLAPNYIWHRVREDIVLNREGLGFHYTSTGPTVFLGFTLQYIYLRKENLKFWEPLILEAIAVFFFWKTDSRMPFYLGSVLLLFFFFESLFKKHWKVADKLRGLGIIAPVVIGAGTVAGYLLYDGNSAGWQKLNLFLTGRLQLGEAAINTYGINLFGHDITWIGNGMLESDLPYNFVDTSYIQVMLTEGVLFLVAMIAIYTIANIKAVRIKDYWLVCIILFIALYAVIEPYLVNFAATPLIILAFADLNRQPLSYGRGEIKNIWTT